jgi:molybdate transport system regulatory protein
MEHGIVRISARNTLRGIVRSIEPGAVNSEITLEIAPAITVTSIITNDAVKDLGLKVGQPAYAVIKASSVMIGVD